MDKCYLHHVLKTVKAASRFIDQIALWSLDYQRVIKSSSNPILSGSSLPRYERLLKQSALVTVVSVSNNWAKFKVKKIQYCRGH